MSTDIISTKIRYPFFYFIYLVVVWTAFRLSGVILPQEVDEFLIKPIVWLLPIYFIVRKNNNWPESLGLTGKNLYPGIYLALILGFIFAGEAVLVNYIKYGDFSFAASIGRRPFVYLMFISLATAVSEEIAFRGFIFSRFWKYFKNEILANLITSLLWVVIRMPALIAVLGFGGLESAGFLLISLFYSIGACFIYARTQNVFASIVLYVLWEAPIILFR